MLSARLSRSRAHAHERTYFVYVHGDICVCRATVDRYGSPHLWVHAYIIGAPHMYPRGVASPIDARSAAGKPLT